MLLFNKAPYVCLAYKILKVHHNVFHELGGCPGH